MTIRRILTLLCVVFAVSSAVFAVDAPGNFTIVHTSGNVELRWSAVVGAVRYNVYRETTEITDVTSLFPQAVVNAPTVTYSEAVSGTQYYYVVTAEICNGNLLGTITDTTGLGAQNALVEYKNLSDAAITGIDYTDGSGNYEFFGLPCGDYFVCVYKEQRPVAKDTVTVTDLNTTDWDYTWPAFTRVHVAAGTLAGVTNWTNDNVYELDGVLRVGHGATLNIEEGTTVNGTSSFTNNIPNAVCFINTLASTTGDGTDNGVLNIYGSKHKPVVFTSGRLPADGAQRTADWGGLILDGDATTNRGRLATGEGGTGPYGNAAANASDTQSSGYGRYFRVDYAGYPFTPNNELNSMAFQACGSGTDYAYFQCFKGADDGVELFGGRNSIHHVIVQDNGDDGFDYTSGWIGTAHNVVVYCRGFVSQSAPAIFSDKGIEADNKTTEPGESNDYNAAPRAVSNLANFTLVGHQGVASLTQTNLANPRAGTQFNWFNMIFTLGGSGAIDMDNAETALAGVAGASRVDNCLFWDNGGAATEGISGATGAGIGDGHFFVEDAEWSLSPTCAAPATFPVNSHILAAPTGWTQDLANYRGCGFSGTNTTTVIADPMLVAPTSYDARPAAGSPALNASNAASAGTLSPYGLPYAPYLGAFSGPNDDWHIGWYRTN